MKRRRLISKGSLSRLLGDVAQGWRRQAYHEAFALLERATSLDSANTNLLLDLGRAYGMRYDYAAAERCLDKAVSVSPKRLDTLAEAARRSQEFENYEMVKRYLESLAALPGAPAEALVRLAELNERRSRLEEANEIMKRGLSSKP